MIEGIEAQGGKALAVQADIAKLEDIRRLYRETIRHLDRLDIVVANAGYACFKAMEDITEEDFGQTYALNAKGTYFSFVCKRRCATWSRAAGSSACQRSAPS